MTLPRPPIELSSRKCRAGEGAMNDETRKLLKPGFPRCASISPSATPARVSPTGGGGGAPGFVLGDPGADRSASREAEPRVTVRCGRMRAASSRARPANFRGKGLLALPPQDPHQLARRHRAGQGHPSARPMGTVPEFTDSLRGSVQRLPGVVGYRVARDFVGRSQVPEVGEEVRERPGRAARDGLPGTAIAFTTHGAGRRGLAARVRERSPRTGEIGDARMADGFI